MSRSVQTSSVQALLAHSHARWVLFGRGTTRVWDSVRGASGAFISNRLSEKVSQRAGAKRSHCTTRWCRSGRESSVWPENTKFKQVCLSGALLFPTPCLPLFCQLADGDGVDALSCGGASSTQARGMKRPSRPGAPLVFGRSCISAQVCSACT